MPSLLSTAIQNTFIKATANLTAQLAIQWSSKEPQPLDRQRILEFAVFGFFGATFGYVWHLFLEHKFPTHPRPSRPVIAPGEKDKDKDFAAAAAATPPAVPGQTETQDRSSSLSWRNVVAKLVADQTIGLSFMITVFLIITNVARVPHLADVLDVIHEKLWRLVRAGWNLWPIVAVCNFLWVPVRWRVLVSSCVGFVWNIFLSVVSMTGPVVTKGGS